MVHVVRGMSDKRVMKGKSVEERCVTEILMRAEDGC